MSLFRLQEFNSLDTETLIESFLSETLEIKDLNRKDLEKEIETEQFKLKNYSKHLEENEKEIKKLIDNKPVSWLEKKLESFKAAIERFEKKYGLTDDNTSKSIIKKILAILTRLVKFINEKLLKLTKYVGNKFFNREEKLKKFKSELDDKMAENHAWKVLRDGSKEGLEYGQERLAELNKGVKPKEVKLDTNSNKPFDKKNFNKIMSDKTSKLVFR